MLDSSRNRRRHESGAINLEEDQRNTAVEVRGRPVKPSHSRCLQDLKQYGWAVFAVGRGSRDGITNVYRNPGFLLETQGALRSVAELMQVQIDYLRAIEHPDAEKAASRVEQIRQKLK